MNEIEVIESEFDCSKIEERMQSYIDRGILSCCSTLLMKGSEVVDYRTFGFMDLEDKHPLRKDAILSNVFQYKNSYLCGFDEPL